MALSCIPAEAHGGGTWYDVVGAANARFPWDSAADTIYAFSSGSTWNTGWKPAIEVADGKWDDLLGSALFITLSAEEPFPGEDCSIDFNGQQLVRRGQTQQDVQASTTRCKNLGTGAYGRWYITIDSSYTWFTGSGQAPPGDQHLRGIMTHEFGHATGFGSGTSGSPHFVEGDGACTTSASTRATMCVSWGGATYDSLEHEMTSLEDHDKHTFLNVYP